MSWLKANYQLATILIIGTVLRFVSINQSVWLDEAISANVARSYTIVGIIFGFSQSDFHPPFYYILLKLWSTAFGTSEIGLRSLSVFFGVVSIFVIYKLGQKLFSEKVGVIAALLLAIAPLHIYYSQEARMYSFETLLVLVSVWLFWRLVHHPTVLSTLLFAGVNILLFYTDYLPMFMFCVYLVWLLWHHKETDKRVWRGFFVATGLVVASFFPFLKIFQEQLSLGQLASQSAWSKALGFTSVKALALVWVKFLIGRISFDNTVVYLGYVLVNSVIAGSALFYTFMRRTQAVFFCLLWLVLPLLIGSAIALRFSIFDYFRFIYVLPALYLLIAYGISAIRNNAAQKLLIVTVILQLVSAALYLVQPQFHREDWRSAVRYIEANSTSQSVSIFPNPAQSDAYQYYATGKVPIGGRDSYKSATYDKIWLMRYVQDIYDPQDVIRQDIKSRGYTKKAEHDFNRVIIWEYQR